MAQVQRADEDEGQQRSARRPEHTAKVSNVEIAVWKNTGKNGEFFTASTPTIARAKPLLTLPRYLKSAFDSGAGGFTLEG